MKSDEWEPLVMRAWRANDNSIVCSTDGFDFHRRLSRNRAAYMLGELIHYIAGKIGMDANTLAGYAAELADPNVQDRRRRFIFDAINSVELRKP